MDSDVYPSGVPCWIDLVVADVDAAAAFYGGVFGWEVGAATEAGADAGAAGSAYLVGRLGARAVAGIRGGGTGRGVWRTYVCVDDAGAAVRRVTSAGGRVVAEPAKVDGVAVTALVADPAGAVLGLWQPDGIRGAGLVNAPDTWNFSNLTTPDPGGSTAFYGTVFGWQARPVQLGEGVPAATMWCLPGYGETQDAKEPGFLRRHAEGGTPEGFTDAFGWREEAATPDTTASWDVTFAVDDVDAVVDRARRRGGEVVVDPFDAGPARIAVLADPAGAPFTVSAYQP